MNSPEVILASMFTNHMVLQQGTRVPVWGSGPEGAVVTVLFQGQTQSAPVRNGRWTVTLEPLAAGGPFEMTVRTGGRERTLHDVLVGEVWFAAGQSNMVQQLLVTEDGLEEAEQAYNPKLRFFTTPRRPYPEAAIPGWEFMATFTNHEAWQLCTPRNALYFSAIGYYFGQRLQEARQVPVGIVSCSFGGTPIEAWMDEDTLIGDPDLAKKLADYLSFINQMNPLQYEEEWNAYLSKMLRWKREREEPERTIRAVGLEGYRRLGREHPLDWTPYPRGPKAPERPGALYHSMLESAMPYAIAGVLWYQGESNTASLEEAFLYRRWLPKLIENWRNVWGNPGLPFLVVQLTAFAPGGKPDGERWAILRESQDAAVRSVPGTGLVVTIDCGEAEDIHPVSKRVVAERSFMAALSVAYGEPVSHFGPRFRSVIYEPTRALLSFEGARLSNEERMEEIRGFAVAGADRRFFPAQARIVGERVEVWSERVPVPIAVRYAWADMPECGLYGTNGLPAAPFRTDQFDL